MAGRFALGTEVARSLDEAKAEEVLPETIHRDAGGEGILRADDPLGQVQPGGAVGDGRRQRRQESGGLRLHGLAGFVIGTALHDVRLTRFRDLAHDVGGGQRAVEIFHFFFHGGDGADQRLHRGLGRLADIDEEMFAQLGGLLGG